MPETGAAAALRVAGATQSPTQKAVGLVVDRDPAS